MSLCLYYPVKNYQVIRVRGAKETYKKYLKPVEDGLVLKSIVIHSDMTPEERKDVLRALVVAHRYTAGGGEKKSGE